jgi:hypothetical protein
MVEKLTDYTSCSHRHRMTRGSATASSPRVGNTTKDSWAVRGHEHRQVERVSDRLGGVTWRKRVVRWGTARVGGAWGPRRLCCG